MRPVARWLSVLLAVVLALLLSPGTARADDTPSSWRITRYDASAVFAQDGTAEVTLDFDFFFGSDEGHGPFITLPERQRVTGNPDVWRMIDVTIGEVSSGTGAATDTLVSHSDGNLVVRVGHEHMTWTGSQNYRITYKIRGLVDPDNRESGLDEVNWQAIGPGWQVPIDHAKVTIEGGTPERVACWWGSTTRTRARRQDGLKGCLQAGNLGPAE